MLGIILIYFLGKAFYDLAVSYDKHQYKWGYAILAVACYYAGAIIGGIALVILYELFGMGNMDDLSDRLVGLLAVPFGLLTCWIAYRVLERRWGNQIIKNSDNDILDSELL